MAPKISVIVVVRNERNYISDCIQSILNQTHPDFELILVDDCSDDGTSEVLGSFNDGRVIIIRNERNLGISASRNVGLAKASGTYVFFTDADCVPARNWLEEGLRIFSGYNVVGVEGRTLYEHAKITPTFADRVVQNVNRENPYLTANMAYQREVVERAGGFDIKFGNSGEDKDLAFKVLKSGDIAFCRDMLVVHRYKKHTSRSLIASSRNITGALHLYVDHGFGIPRKGRVIHWARLLYILSPPMILIAFTFRRWEDFKLLPAFYVQLLLERMYIWKFAFQNRILLI